MNNKYISACNSLILANEVKKHEKLKRIENYLKTPKLCLYCKSIIPYEKRNNKFCSSTCSAKYNIPLWINDSVIQKRNENISSSLKMKNAQNPNKPLKINKQYCNIKHHICSVCDKPYYTNSWSKRSTCSILCSRLASHKNFKTKIVFNKYQNKDVVLESGWEILIADFLNTHNIEWVRPDPLLWVDSKNKNRKYYPDFYLPLYDIYIDPKNSHIIEKDREKLSVISSKVTLIYGDVDYIKSHIIQIKRTPLNSVVSV